MFEIPSFSDEIRFVGPPATEYEMAEALDAQTIKEIDLNKDELELAVGLLLAAKTNPGQWLFRRDERDRPIAALREEIGGQVEGTIRTAINKAVEKEMIELDFTHTKTDRRLANVRLTPLGRQSYTEQAADHPQMVSRIEACRLSHIHKIIVLVRREVYRELKELNLINSGGSPELVSLMALDDVSKAKAYLAELRDTQTYLLEKIEIQDRQRRAKTIFKLPEAA